MMALPQQALFLLYNIFMLLHERERVTQYQKFHVTLVNFKHKISCSLDVLCLLLLLADTNRWFHIIYLF